VSSVGAGIIEAFLSVKEGDASGLDQGNTEDCSRSALLTIVLLGADTGVWLGATATSAFSVAAGKTVDAGDS
jgi:hypothetical protein